MNKMKRVKRVFSNTAFLALALSASCVGQPGHLAIYSPIEAGLVLQYEGMELDTGQLSQNRLQLWVRQTKQTPEGLEVECAASTYQGTASVVSLCQHDGSVFLMAPSGGRIMVLPSGFPYKIAAWQSDGINYRVVGRAKADISCVTHPDNVGIWVEAQPIPPQSSILGFEKVRYLFLPGIGESQTMAFLDGKWITVNKLTGKSHANAL